MHAAPAPFVVFLSFKFFVFSSQQSVPLKHVVLVCRCCRTSLGAASTPPSSLSRTTSGRSSAPTSAARSTSSRWLFWICSTLGPTHRVDRVPGFFSSRPNRDSPTPSSAGDFVPHRVGRVLSFFSSRPNRCSPTPSPAGGCASPPLFG